MTKHQSNIGVKMFSLAEKLFPICRSITGNGVRESLAILQKHIPIEIKEVPTGTAVFDWTIPKEWNIKDAWVKNEQGEKIIDFKNNNLHLLNYSIPIHQKMDLETLKEHLFTLPEQPNLIPYRTSYYQENWGFCLSHQKMEELKEGIYEVMIDSTLEAGSLTYGELLIPGETEEEVLLSTHICHPSLANDNLSGISLLTFLGQFLRKQKNRYTYRLIFIPGTIGAITWLAQNEKKVHRIKHGIVASLVGDAGAFTWKKSRRGDTEIDRAVTQVLKDSGYDYEVIDFFPYGYDERQFCSPGFDLAVGNLGRSRFGEFPEYHTSADNLDFVNSENLKESFEIYKSVIELLENNFTYLNLQPKCEPQLGKRGLYDAIGGESDRKIYQMAMLWVLNYSDGENDLLAIAERSGYSFEVVLKVQRILEEKGLLKQINLE